MSATNTTPARRPLKLGPKSSTTYKQKTTLANNIVFAKGGALQAINAEDRSLITGFFSGRFAEDTGLDCFKSVFDRSGLPDSDAKRLFREIQGFVGNADALAKTFSTILLDDAVQELVNGEYDKIEQWPNQATIENSENFEILIQTLQQEVVANGKELKEALQIAFAKMLSVLEVVGPGKLKFEDHALPSIAQAPAVAAPAPISVPAPIDTTRQKSSLDEKRKLAKISRNIIQDQYSRSIEPTKTNIKEGDFGEILDKWNMNPAFVKGEEGFKKLEKASGTGDVSTAFATSLSSPTKPPLPSLGGSGGESPARPSVRPVTLKTTTTLKTVDFAFAFLVNLMASYEPRHHSLIMSKFNFLKEDRGVSKEFHSGNASKKYNKSRDITNVANAFCELISSPGLEHRKTKEIFAKTFKELCNLENDSANFIAEGDAIDCGPAIFALFARAGVGSAVNALMAANVEAIETNIAALLKSPTGKLPTLPQAGRSDAAASGRPVSRMLSPVGNSMDRHKREGGGLPTIVSPGRGDGAAAAYGKSGDGTGKSPIRPSGRALDNSPRRNNLRNTAK